MKYDVIIVGGGPAGLSAALALGRARKRTLLCDAGPPRNAAAVHVQNFVTRDGIPPSEFRRIAAEQLQRYPNVEMRKERVLRVEGARGSFRVQLETITIEASRVLLCTGMIDELPAIEGFASLWGTSIFACPYCHGWEVQDRRFAYLAADAEGLAFALLLRSWTSDVIALTGGAFAVPPDTAARFAAAGLPIEERAIARLRSDDARLAAIEFADGSVLERDVVFAHPRQRQVDVVQQLGLALDAHGFVKIDETTRETSVPGIYAGGDLITHAQGAVLAAASGTLAASRLNFALMTQEVSRA
jgi:thioredoxin reductase